MTADLIRFQWKMRNISLYTVKLESSLRYGSTKLWPFFFYAVKNASGFSHALLEQYSWNDFPQYMIFCLVKWYETVVGKKLKVDAIDLSMDCVMVRWQQTSDEHDRYKTAREFGLILIESDQGAVHVVPRNMFISQTSKCSKQTMKLGSFFAKHALDGRERDFKWIDFIILVLRKRLSRMKSEDRAVFNDLKKLQRKALTMLNQNWFWACDFLTNLFFWFCETRF